MSQRPSAGAVARDWIDCCCLFRMTERSNDPQRDSHHIQNWKQPQPPAPRASGPCRLTRDLKDSRFRLQTNESKISFFDPKSVSWTVPRERLPRIERPKDMTAPTIKRRASRKPLISERRRDMSVSTSGTARPERHNDAKEPASPKAKLRGTDIEATLSHSQVVSATCSIQ
jgi:hypothetical protein